MDWVVYSLIAAFGFGIMSLLITHLTRLHVGAMAINFWSFLNATVLFLLISLFSSRQKLKIPSGSIEWFAFLAITAVMTNYCSVKALAAGPNTGVVRSLLMIQVLVAAIGAYFFFHQGLSVRTAFGSLLVVVGLVLIVNK